MIISQMDQLDALYLQKYSPQEKDLESTQDEAQIST